MAGLLQHMGPSKKAIGMSCVLGPSGLEKHSALLLELKGGEIDILERYAGTAEFSDELRKHMASLPIVLAISGQGVIHKVVGRIAEGKDLASQVIPGADPSKFHVQSVILHDQALLSIARLEQVQALLSSFDPDQLILDLRLGAYSCPPLMSSLLQESLLSDSTSTLSLDNGRLKISAASNETADKHYAFDGLEFSSDELPALLAGAHYLLGEVPCELEGLRENREQFKFRSLTRTTVFAGVFGLLFLLVGSYFLSEHYAEEYASLQSLERAGAQQMSEVQELRIKVRNDQELSRYLGVEKDLSFAALSDRIASLVPAAVVLQELSVHPEMRQSDPRKRVALEVGKARVKGATKDESAVGRFMSELKEVGGIQNVDLRSLSKDPRTGMHRFELYLSL